MSPAGLKVESQLLRLESLGFSLRGFSIPRFQLHAGEAICLHAIIEPSEIWYDIVVPMLSGHSRHPRYRLNGSICYLERPMPRRGWFGRWKNPRAIDWLVTHKHLSPGEATQVLDRLLVPPELLIGSMGWNERSMLALEATLLNSPDVLVFDTAGQDSVGIQRMFERMKSRPQGLALIYLKTYLEPISPCFPAKSCLEMSRQTVSAE